VAHLTEDEALKISITLEESWAYEYKEAKRVRGESGGEVGLRAGFEEDFSFGEEDDNDYWSGTDLID
jgi:hypothetical protein